VATAGAKATGLAIFMHHAFYVHVFFLGNSAKHKFGAREKCLFVAHCECRVPPRQLFHLCNLFARMPQVHYNFLDVTAISVSVHYGEA
jgi:hypothetical protein